MDGLPPFLVGGPAVLLLSGFVKGRSLGYAVIVAFPFDPCIGWECEEALDCLPVVLLVLL